MKPINRRFISRKHSLSAPASQVSKFNGIFRRVVNPLILILFVSVILFMAVKGLPGNIHESNMNQPSWTDSGPFELSVERGRFALAYSLVENKSFFFSSEVAKFTTPDLGLKNGKFVSLFAPGVSYLVIPGYLVGKLFGVSQVGAFLVISLFALINFFLVRATSIRLQANPNAATLGALAFLFATPAFTYSTTIYQHHVSTFLILSSLYLLLRFNNLKSLFLVWFMLACSIPVDYPNLFLMFPIGLYSFTKFIQLTTQSQKMSIHIKPTGFLALTGVVLPLLFFLWFNYHSYGHPLQFSGTVSQVKDLDASGNPRLPDSETAEQTEFQEENRSALRWFRTRQSLNGLYIMLFSPDRGVVFFTPVILVGLIGVVILYRKQVSILPVWVGVIIANLLLYSMWSDVWGGWAFGSRYLIPSYSIMGIFTAIGLSHYRKSIIVHLLFLSLFIYSVGVNTLGAITSSRNPPKVEILGLEQITGREEKYTYWRNYDFLKSGSPKSFVYQTYFHPFINSVQYFYILTSAVIIFAIVHQILLPFSKHDNS